MTYTIAAIAVVLVWNIVVTLRGMADLNRCLRETALLAG